MNRLENRHEIFNRIIEDIFRLSGYTISPETNSSLSRVDIIAKKEEHNYYIEVKSPTKEYIGNLAQYERSIEIIYDISKDNEATPVLVVLSKIDETNKKVFCEKYRGLIILDISNLLYAIKGTDYYEDLILYLPYTTDNIIEEKSEIDLGWIEHKDTSKELLIRLDNCTAGREDAEKFENVCCDLLKYIFSDDLALWKIQETSNTGLYRFDLLCRIKDNNSKTFWSMMEQHFHSKYIIFEFKNYSSQITQKEIYTTERYLYSKALRNVAIIIAKNGFDENSIWAAKGSLRENGKLILPITTDDLKKMCELKTNQDDPSECLLEKIDSFLAELEK